MDFNHSLLQAPDSKTRLAFIHNPSIPQSPHSIPRAPVSWLLSHLHTRELLSNATPSPLLSALGLDVPVAPTDGPQIPIGGKAAFEKVTGGVDLKDTPSEVYDDYLKSSRLLSRNIKLKPGHKAIVVNGRVISPIEGNDFLAADFRALEDYEFRKRAEPVWLALADISQSMVTDKILAADVVSMAASVLAASQQADPSEIGLFDAPPRPRQRGYEFLESLQTAFKIGDISTALYHIAVLLDPPSKTGQKWSSILKVEAPFFSPCFMLNRLLRSCYQISRILI